MSAQRQTDALVALRLALERLQETEVGVSDAGGWRSAEWLDAFAAVVLANVREARRETEQAIALIEADQE